MNNQSFYQTIPLRIDGRNIYTFDFDKRVPVTPYNTYYLVWWLTDITPISFCIGYGTDVGLKNDNPHGYVWQMNTGLPITFTPISHLVFSFELLPESKKSELSSNTFTKWTQPDKDLFHLGLSTANTQDIRWDHFRYYGQAFIPKNDFINGVKIPMNLTSGHATIHIEIREEINSPALFSKEITFSAKGVERVNTLDIAYETNPPTSQTHCNINRHLLYLVTGGKGRFRSEWVTAELSMGTIFFGINGRNYQIENTDHLEYMSIGFYGSRANELMAMVGCTMFHSVFYGHEQLIPFWQNSMANLHSQNADILSEGLLLSTFSALAYQKEETDSDTFRNVINYLDNHFTDHQLTLKGLANQYGYNARYLSKLFTQKMGVKFSEYLTQIRIQYALRLMEQGVTSIRNLANLVGYSDPLYFSKVFKKAMKVPPKEYIASHIFRP